MLPKVLAYPPETFDHLPITIVARQFGCSLSIQDTKMLGLLVFSENLRG